MIGLMIRYICHVHNDYSGTDPKQWYASVYGSPVTIVVKKNCFLGRLGKRGAMGIAVKKARKE